METIINLFSKCDVIILLALALGFNLFNKNMDKKFDKIDQRFEEVHQEFKQIRSEIKEI